jgi:two-component system, cell cycle response regulator
VIGTAASTEYSDPPSSYHGPERVLICSSSEEVANVLAATCHAERLEVRIVRHPDSLLKQALNWEPDLLLLDQTVHDVPALELCGELRACESLRHTPLMIVCSVSPQPEWVAAGLLAGADDFCSMEPEWQVALRARIHAQLRNRRYRNAVVRLREERNQLRSRASKDSLTGALGRRALEDVVQAEYRAANPFAVLFVDIDHFKSVNDTYGHQVGDAVLRQVAIELQQGCRGSDVCGRYGGEEFILVLSKVTTPQAVSAAERHRERIKRLEFRDVGGPPSLTVSIGVAVFDPSQPDETPYVLLRRADVALYEAKNGGRDRVVLAPSFNVTERNGSLRASRGNL